MDILFIWSGDLRTMAILKTIFLAFMYPVNTDRHGSLFIPASSNNQEMSMNHVGDRKDVDSWKSCEYLNIMVGKMNFHKQGAMPISFNEGRNLSGVRTYYKMQTLSEVT